jgi:hypothetical protein
MCTALGPAPVSPCAPMRLHEPVPSRRRVKVADATKIEVRGLCRKYQELCVKWKSSRGVHAKSKGAGC